MVAFLEERALPSAVTGPRDLAPLARAASFCLSVVVSVSLDSHQLSALSDQREEARSPSQFLFRTPSGLSDYQRGALVATPPLTLGALTSLTPLFCWPAVGGHHWRTLGRRWGGLVGGGVVGGDEAVGDLHELLPDAGGALEGIAEGENVGLEIGAGEYDELLGLCLC